MSKKAIANIEIDSIEHFIGYNKILLTQNFFGHHEFEVHVPIEFIEEDGQFVFTKSKDLIGKNIKFNLESDQLLDTQSPTFNGIITDVHYSRLHGFNNEVILKGKSPSILLEGGYQTRSFTEKKLLDIVQEILGAYPSNLVGNKVDPVYKEVIPYIVQYKETDFHFLNRIANLYGEWFFYNGKEICFGQANFPDPLDLMLGRDLVDFHLGMSLAPVNFQLDTYHYETNELLSSLSKDQKVNHLDSIYGKPAFEESEKLFAPAPLSMAYQPLANQEELNQFVQRKRDQQSSNMIKLKGTGDNITVWIGQTATISGSKSEDAAEGLENYGQFIITNVIHRIHGNGFYTHDFEGIPKGVGVPPSNHLVRPSYAESQIAVVKDNKDPEKMGRVRVKFYWQKSPEWSPWIRLISDHAGSAGGMYIIPEIEDEVMIGFVHNNPDKPFVLGSLYHSNAKPTESWYTDQNYIKSFKTKGGNEIIFNDEEGKESIKIVNKGKNSITLTMSEGGGFSMSGCNEVSLSGKNISINASEDLTLSANNITIDAQMDFKTTAVLGDTKINTLVGDTEINTIVGDTEINTMVGDTGINTLIGDMAINTLGDTNVKAKNYHIEANDNIEINAKAELKTSSGKDTTIKSGTNLNLDAGANANVKAKGNADIKGTAGAKVAGAMVNVEGTGVTTIKGAIIQLN